MAERERRTPLPSHRIEEILAILRLACTTASSSCVKAGRSCISENLSRRIWMASPRAVLNLSTALGSEKNALASWSTEWSLRHLDFFDGSILVAQALPLLKISRLPLQAHP
jgi:hypothetical protein